MKGAGILTSIDLSITADGVLNILKIKILKKHKPNKNKMKVKSVTRSS